MRSKVVGFVAAAALLASVGVANAKAPVKLTDGQLDKVTAGATEASGYLAGNAAANVMPANVTANVAADPAAVAALRNLASVNTAAPMFANAAITP